MDNTEGLGAAMEAAANRDRSQSQEKRIHALELQVQTLTAAVQHLMLVTKPLIQLAQQAEAQASGILLGR
jgi:hypothetical protein